MESQSDKINKLKADLTSALNDTEATVRRDIEALVGLLSINPELKLNRYNKIMDNIKRMATLEARIKVIDLISEGDNND